MDNLEIMRQQLSSLKEQLDTQKIINKELMSKVMRNKASWLNVFVNIEIVTLPIIYFIVAGASSALGISQWYGEILLFFATVDVILDWYLIRISPKKFSKLSIIELKRFLYKQKKYRLIQTIVMAPISVIWVIAFFRAFFSKLYIFPMAEIPTSIKAGFWICLAAAIVASIIVVIVLFKKMQRTNDALISDITELEREE
ncbi:MAG: hypothetical protein K2H18_07395 [Muribaculaceae bacterium]|nr:hypothetical protein [Muribaculaceae bacterium]